MGVMERPCSDTACCREEAVKGVAMGLKSWERNLNGQRMSRLHLETVDSGVSTVSENLTVGPSGRQPLDPQLKEGSRQPRERSAQGPVIPKDLSLGFLPTSAQPALQSQLWLRGCEAEQEPGLCPTEDQ